MSNSMDLSMYDDEFQQTQVIDRGYKLPNGRYRAEISGAELDTDSFGNARFTLVLVIMDGEYESVCIPFDNGFHDSNKLLFLKKALIGCGKGSLKPSDLQRKEVRDSFIGLTVELESYTTESKKNGKTYSGNLKINRVLKAGNVAPVAAIPLARPAAPKQATATAQLLDDSGLPF